jgi:hypothetical protein
MDKTNALKICICQGCPSYVECKGNIAFCFSGKSKCINMEAGCMCGGCPVHKEMKFKNYYYCLKGTDRGAK